MLSITGRVAMWIMRASSPSNLYLWFLFQFFFLLQTSRTVHPGPALRYATLCLMIPLTMSRLNTPIAIPIAIALGLWGVSQMTVLYSHMQPLEAIWWFVRRSIRKETVFVFAMVAGSLLLG